MIELPIDYRLLGRAVEWYQDNGYEMINVDWMVDPKYCFATYPVQAGQFQTLDSNNNLKSLVGSAEQGFLKAVVDGRVKPDTRYMSASPCFRRGDVGPINNEWFMKLELSAFSMEDRNLFAVFLSDAHDAFAELGCQPFHLLESFPPGDDEIANVDIVYSETLKPDADLIELGSYGFREIKGLTDYNFLLHYGTGLALPRFQLIL